MPQSHRNHGPARAGGSGGGASGRPNSLGLNGKELEQLLNEIDGPAGDDAASSKRRYVRRPFRQTTIPLRLTQPNGQATTFAVACRNLSRSGMSLLHSAYVHIGTRVVVGLPNGTGYVSAAGKVVRCQHRRGIVHDVGVLFDEPINTGTILRSDLFSDWFSLENVNPEELSGNVLYIDESALDRRFVRYYLRETNIALTIAEDGRTGQELSQQSFDLIICDYQTAMVDGVPLVVQIRAKGVQTPVMMLSADNSKEARDGLAQLAVQAYLTKPLAPSLLLRAIAEFVSPDAVRGKASSPAGPAGHGPAEAPAQELMVEFLQDLEHCADELERSAAAGDAEGCRRVALRLKGAAPAVGFNSIATQAQSVLGHMAHAKSPGDVKEELQKLVFACRNAKRRKVA